MNKSAVLLISLGAIAAFTKPAAASLATVQDLAVSGWELIESSGRWTQNLLQQNSVSSGQILAQLDIGVAEVNQESAWMTLIDLVKSCDLQLNPYADLRKKFNTQTDEFFAELEKLEGELTSQS